MQYILVENKKLQCKIVQVRIHTTLQCYTWEQWVSKCLFNTYPWAHFIPKPIDSLGSLVALNCDQLPILVVAIMMQSSTSQPPPFPHHCPCSQKFPVDDIIPFSTICRGSHPFSSFFYLLSPPPPPAAHCFCSSACLHPHSSSLALIITTVTVSQQNQNMKYGKQGSLLTTVSSGVLGRNEKTSQELDTT